MPVRINRVARGLLSFLDSKTAGQPPQLVADDIRATIDLNPFFEAGQVVDMFGQVASASTGVVGIALASNFMGVGGGAFQVPPGEVWLLRNMTARTGTLPAATDYMFTVGYQATLPGIAGAATWYDLSQPVAIGTWTAGAAASAGAQLPAVLVAGDQLGIHIQRVALGTAQNFQVAARAMRLQV